MLALLQLEFVAAFHRTVLRVDLGHQGEFLALGPDEGEKSLLIEGKHLLRFLRKLVVLEKLQLRLGTLQGEAGLVELDEFVLEGLLRDELALVEALRALDRLLHDGELGRGDEGLVRMRRIVCSASPSPRIFVLQEGAEIDVGGEAVVRNEREGGDVLAIVLPGGFIGVFSVSKAFAISSVASFS